LKKKAENNIPEWEQFEDAERSKG